MKWWKEHWYGALVALIVGGILVYCGYLVNFQSVEGIIVKTENDHLYLIRIESSYAEIGSIVLTRAAKETIDRTKYNTGDRVKIQGKISIAETWPAQYHGVRRIIIKQPYDEESLQVVKDKLQVWDNGFLNLKPIYPE